MFFLKLIIQIRCISIREHEFIDILIEFTFFLWGNIYFTSNQVGHLVVLCIHCHGHQGGKENNDISFHDVFCFSGLYLMTVFT